jgi:hypothetical protein
MKRGLEREATVPVKTSWMLALIRLGIMTAFLLGQGFSPVIRQQLEGEETV